MTYKVQFLLKKEKKKRKKELGVGVIIIVIIVYIKKNLLKYFKKAILIKINKKSNYVVHLKVARIL